MKRLLASLTFSAIACAPANIQPAFVAESPADAGVAASADKARRPRCTQAELQNIFAPASSPTDSVVVGCSLLFSDYQPSTANPSKTITKHVIVETSNVTIDCGGGNLFPVGERALTIRSRRTSANAFGGTWQRTNNTIVRNCNVHRRTEIQAMGEGTGSDGYNSSRYNTGHTARAQEAAPRNTRLQNNSYTNFGTAIYANVGTTQLIVDSCTFTENSEFVAIYLNAESAQNQILNSTFNYTNIAREVIAIDGSANNIVRGNTFTNAEVRSAVRLYRNCGERGMIRHQAPQNNIIENNRMQRYNPSLVGSLFPSIVVGSRMGEASYCNEDNGFPFGSSADNGDFATNNIVRNNLFDYTVGGSSGSNVDSNRGVIAVNYSPNNVSGNVVGNF